MNLIERRPNMKRIHRFRSRVLDLAVIADRLYALTERGTYRQDKNGKRWRKVAPYPVATASSQQP